MEFIAAKCPQCNSNLEVPDDKEIFECSYCGATIVVKEIAALQKYISNWMRIATSAFKAGNKKEAYSYYNKILEVDSSNHKAWFGKALSCEVLGEKSSYFETAISFVPGDLKAEVSEKAANSLFISAAEMYGSLSGNIDLQNEIIEALEAAHRFDPKNPVIIRKLIEVIHNSHWISNDKIIYYEAKLKELDKDFVTTAEKTAENLKLQEAIDKKNAEEGALRELKNKQADRRNKIFLVIMFLLMIGFVIFVIVMVRFEQDKNKTSKTNDEPKEEMIKELSPLDKYGFEILDKYAAKQFYIVSVMLKTDSADEIKRVSQELYNSYKMENSRLYFNFYTRFIPAAGYEQLQSKYSMKEIINNPNQFGLKGIAECDTKTGKFIFYINEMNKMKKIN
jgi:tetratricopeptide (TPR) repeat protein